MPLLLSLLKWLLLLVVVVWIPAFPGLRRRDGVLGSEGDDGDDEHVPRSLFQWIRCFVLVLFLGCCRQMKGVCKKRIEKKKRERGND